MNQEAMVCMPGPWKDRTEFVQRVVTHTKGDFTFAVDKNDIDTCNSIAGATPGASPCDGDNSVDNVRFSVMWSKDFELM